MNVEREGFSASFQTGLLFYMLNFVGAFGIDDNQLWHLDVLITIFMILLWCFFIRSRSFFYPIKYNVWSCLVACFVGGIGVFSPALVDIFSGDFIFGVSLFFLIVVAVGYHYFAMEV